MSRDRYEMVAGLEVHVHLRTRTKAFCACAADFGAPPNSHTCPVCLGLPGALPVLNAHAVTLAVRTALALGCEVAGESVFARKHYFYPDLPKGYQISQFDRPLASDGALTFDSQPASRTVGITRLHIEEDAGKSIHDRFPGETAIDLNRSGVPLIEVVSEPEIRSPEEAGAWLRALKQLLEYLDVSDANMEEGSLRVDANVSARPRGTATLGTKTEIKNMNSFSAVERALDVEFTRHCELLDRGEPVVQQTMLWDAGRGTVRPARGKEESHDYRYFPEPDLPPLVLARGWIEAERAALPELPAPRRGRTMREFGIPQYDADVLTATRALADYFETLARAHGDGKTAANWVMGEVLKAVRDEGLLVERFPVPPARLAALLELVREGVVSNTAAKRIFRIMRDSPDAPGDIARREGLLQVGDESQLERWIDEVFASSPDEVARFVAGEKKLLGVLVGLVMKRSGGRADPHRVNQLLTARAAR